MHKAFQVGIYSRDKILYEGQILSLVVPSASGYLGVWADHAPLVARLKPGLITLRDLLGKSMAIELSTQGYLEILQNKVMILFG